MTTTVEKYFAEYFGEWANREEYARIDEGQPPTWVYEWRRPKHGMTTFTTVGYSSVLLPAVGTAHRIEFMFSAKNISFDEAATILLTACETPLDDDLPLHIGHTIGPLEEKIGAGMNRLLLADPWEPEPFGTIELGQNHAEVLMIVPIYESEFQCIRQYGEDSFWDAFENQGLEITNLQRIPVLLERN